MSASPAAPWGRDPSLQRARAWGSPRTASREGHVLVQCRRPVPNTRRLGRTDWTTPLLVRPIAGSRMKLRGIPDAGSQDATRSRACVMSATSDGPAHRGGIRRLALGVVAEKLIALNLSCSSSRRRAAV